MLSLKDSHHEKNWFVLEENGLETLSIQDKGIIITGFPAKKFW